MQRGKGAQISLWHRPKTQCADRYQDRAESRRDGFCEAQFTRPGPWQNLAEHTSFSSTQRQSVTGGLGRWWDSPEYQ